MSTGIAGVHLPLSSTSTMAFRRAESKDTVESTMWVVAKQVFMILPTYQDIKLFIDKDIKIIWQQYHYDHHHNEQHYQQQ